jgi:hypothetical protein
MFRTKFGTIVRIMFEEMFGTTGAQMTARSPEHTSRMEDTRGERLARRLRKAQVPVVRRIPGREKYCHVK